MTEPLKLKLRLGRGWLMLLILFGVVFGGIGFLTARSASRKETEQLRERLDHVVDCLKGKEDSLRAHLEAYGKHGDADRLIEDLRKCLERFEAGEEESVEPSEPAQVKNASASKGS